MNVSALVATYGDDSWRSLAVTRAAPSATRAGADEVIAYHDPDGTLAGSRNAAASKATGEWLCFLDADDELAPGYMDAIRTARTRSLHNTPLLTPAVEYVTAGEVTPPHIPNEGRWPAMNECVIGTVVQRDLFLAVGGFDERWPIYEDYALWLTCDRAGARIVHVPGAVYRAHSRPEGRNQQTGTVRAVTYNEIRRQDRWERRKLGIR